MFYFLEVFKNIKLVATYIYNKHTHKRNDYRSYSLMYYQLLKAYKRCMRNIRK